METKWFSKWEKTSEIRVRLLFLLNLLAQVGHRHRGARVLHLHLKLCVKRHCACLGLNEKLWFALEQMLDLVWKACGIDRTISDTTDHSSEEMHLRFNVSDTTHGHGHVWV